MTKVPFFDYPRHFTDDRESLLSIIDEVASRGGFIMQAELTAFETNLASYTNSRYSVGVANATDGLEIAWMAIGLKPGDEVICSSHTMLATASSIRVAGGTPIPVDIGKDWLIDPYKIEESITEKTVGIMPTQLNGRTCNMDAICELAVKYNLKIVEDAAQALGSKFKGQSAGTFGDASAISFFPAKVLGCLGDAGAVLTQDPDLYDRIYQLHDHGRNPQGEVKSWGRNSRLDNINAAILDYKLKSYGSVVDRRRKIAGMYEQLLGDLEQLQLPPAPTLDGDNFDIYQNYELQADSRDDLKVYLASKGVGSLIQWGGKGIHQWHGLGFENYSLPHTEKFFERCLMLPMNTFISDSDVEYVCKTVREFYGK